MQSNHLVSCALACQPLALELPERACDAPSNMAEEDALINMEEQENTSMPGKEQEDIPMRMDEAEQTSARTEEDASARTEEEEGSVSGSGSGSDSESEEEQVEWLATTREKRATAGNRLASLLQQEESDDELELLFEEPEDDVGFEDAGADSDVQMDSSSDDEDQGPAAGDELEGEKAIQRQERAERQAKKRKLAQVPRIKRKKVNRP